MRKGTTRPRANVIHVYVDDAELETLKVRAGSVGMSLSAFSRAAALHEPIRSIYDQDAVIALSRVNGDLGRVAGLLKLWLAEARGKGVPAGDVVGLMNDFRKLQREALALMGKVHDR